MSRGRTRAGAIRRVLDAYTLSVQCERNWEGDALGRLALTKPGLRARDELVLERCAQAGTPVVVTLAGGYAPDVRDTVDIHAATIAAVAAAAV